jgi:peptidoglycan hydrolase-like protein with peptidoglycan-binding domain/Flp pilus assembly protein TadD
VVLAPGSGTDRSGGSDAVRQLQRGLSDAGYAPGQLDGRYGSLTKAAVVRYQEDRGLVADGVAGPQTRRALSTATPLLYPGAGAEPGGSRLVRTLQRLLAQAGDAVGPVDGRYGPLTEQAVRHFQAVHGLPADGIAGPQTYARLRKPGRSEQRPRPKPGSPGVTHRIPARPGAAQGNPAPAGTRNRGRGVSRPTGVSSTGTRLLIAALVLAVLGIGTQWYMRRRRRGRLVGGIEARSQNHDPSGPAPELTTDLSTSTGDEAAEACNLGVALERQGDIPGAEAAYRRADERGDANGAFNLGGLLADRGDIPGAEAAYRRADERGDPGGAANLGALLERRGDLAGAEAAYHRADMRGDAGGAATLGALLERRGDMAGAEAAYRRAADRGHAGATSTLGGLLSKQNAAGGAETNTPHERRGVFGRPGGGPE